MSGARPPFVLLDIWLISFIQFFEPPLTGFLVLISLRIPAASPNAELRALCLLSWGGAFQGIQHETHPDASRTDVLYARPPGTAARTHHDARQHHGVSQNLARHAFCCIPRCGSIRLIRTASCDAMHPSMHRVAPGDPTSACQPATRSPDFSWPRW